MHDPLGYAGGRQNPGSGGLRAIGAGLPRTGNMSLRRALGTLLGGACYQMTDVHAADDPSEWRFWRRRLRGENASREEWREFLEGRGYVAAIDFPCALFYRDLMEAFPEAKVVLSVRGDGGRGWHRSMEGSVMRMRRSRRGWSVRAAAALEGKAELHSLLEEMGAFAPEWMGGRGFEAAMEGGEESSAAFYDAWVDSVKSFVPPSRLLVLEASQGWAPLCEALSLPSPEEEYPRVNATKQMEQARVNTERAAKITLFKAAAAILVPVAIAVFAKRYYL